MIYILAGNDTKNKNNYIKTLPKGLERVVVPPLQTSKSLLQMYAGNVSLFGQAPIVIVENVLNHKEFELSVDELSEIKNSSTIFVLLEDKLLAVDEKKYKKYAEHIEKFETKIIKEPYDAFLLANAYASKDKIKTWTLYLEAIEKGEAPEAISGMLFWKIKTMILSLPKGERLEQLKKNSSELVSLYHSSHNGSMDFEVGLEQFILNTL